MAHPQSRRASRWKLGGKAANVNLVSQESSHFSIPAQLVSIAARTDDNARPGLHGNGIPDNPRFGEAGLRKIG